MSGQSTLSEDTIYSLINGLHGDPFSILGRHVIDDTAAFVRVYEPTASKIKIGRRAMKKVHDAGVFELTASIPESYTLKITYDDDSVVVKPDAYSFASTLTDDDRYLIAEGTERRLYDKLGPHLMEIDGVDGIRFVVWAPNAHRVSVVGDFNQWDGRRHPMRFHDGSGLWEIFIPQISEGELYKYEIVSRDHVPQLKADPVGFYHEVRPANASIVYSIEGYDWGDEAWLESREASQRFDQPMTIYEVHLGSWQRGEGDRLLTYEELVKRLVPYVKWMGYTHVELLPVTEHPLDASWGYQVTGYFAPTSRFGTPEQFMALVDAFHQAGIGVILDWVPAHFPEDAHGLARFDGTCLYEHEDPRQGFQPDWNTLIFNFGRAEVRQFLINSALFWLDKYHIDGLRVDAVASMLYLDFSRDSGQWVPNQYGGRDNLDALRFIREFNDAVHTHFPGVLTFAEESTAWAGVTAPTEDQGLGFDLKWNMGWMHDSLRYMETDPIYRSYDHGTLTFSMLYAFSERYALPLSHDEVVHLKKSMLGKQPPQHGEDDWQKFANLRLFYSYMAAHPGKKLLFMGSEFGQWQEWSETRSLDWHLVQEGWPHQQLQHAVKRLNELIKAYPALYEVDDSWDGFEWLNADDSENSTLAFIRYAKNKQKPLICAFNFTPVPRYGYRVGVPEEGVYQEVFSSDSAEFGGSNLINPDPISSEPTWWQNQSNSIQLTLPPLGATFLKRTA